MMSYLYSRELKILVFTGLTIKHLKHCEELHIHVCFSEVWAFDDMYIYYRALSAE